MKQISTIKEIKKALTLEKESGHSIGFVPTMGALHEGHLSLIKHSKKDNDITVVSVFLNPTQFNDPKDLETYPVDLEADLQKLNDLNVDFVFTPSVGEMYPDNDVEEAFELGSVAEVMEGKYRPGHFRGVVRIVSKLFRIVNPDRAYFGEKDFQQIAVIKKMVEQMPEINTNIVPCPVIREADGLAMSSRNKRLNKEEREAAPFIYKMLKEAVRLYKQGESVDKVHDYTVKMINEHPQLRVEYFDIVDATTLESIKKWDDSAEPVGCITVYCGEVRLIDHIHFSH